MNTPPNIRVGRKNQTTISASLIALSTLFAIGCQSTDRITPDPRIDAPARSSLRDSLPIHTATGTPTDWPAMLAAFHNADVVVLGETHDDATAHAVQLAILEDMLDQHADTALSMEMLDRRHQSTVDDYLADIIDRDQFLEDIASTKFRRITQDYLDGKLNRKDFKKKIMAVGWPDWEDNYQPMIDLAKSKNARVIAANTPWGRYASLANKHGLERLDELTPAQQALVTAPPMLPTGKYHDLFVEAMGGGTHESTDDADSHAPNEMIEGMYRAQCVMDATMAESIARHLENHAGRVVHLVGRFHSDHRGGLIQQLKHMQPDARIATVSMSPTESTNLLEEDDRRADFIIYTHHPHP
jgi:uncharacterized iron-regulated protein